MFSNRAPCHGVTIQTASYDVILVELDARDCSVMTVKGLERKSNQTLVSKSPDIKTFFVSKSWLYSAWFCVYLALLFV